MNWEITNMKKLAIYMFLLVVLPAFALVTNANALYMLPGNTPVYFQFNNLEQVDQTGANSLSIPGINPLTGTAYPGKQGNWGVFNISTIQSGAIATNHQDISGGTPLFSDTISGGQVHGIFYGINLTTGTTASGGYMDIYYSDNSGNNITSADLNGGAGPTAATVQKFTDGTFLARLDFTPGIIVGDPTTTIKSSVDLTSSLTGQGQADSFASVDTSVVGAWTDVLNGNWFYPDGNAADGTADVRFSNFFNELASWSASGGVLGLRSNDPGRVFTAVPEPSTVLLIGFGLLGLAGVIRRKIKA
jgi:hypothetical protein